MVAPIRLDFAANTAKARAEINALSTTVERLQANLIAATGRNSLSSQMMGLEPTLGRVTNNMMEANAALQNFGGRQVDMSTPVKQTEKLVDNINKGKISLDQYKVAAGKASKVVGQQLALQRASLTNIREEGGRHVADFAYGDISKGITPLQRLAVQAQVSGLALEGLGQHYIDMGKNMAFSARQLTISLTAPFVITSALSMKAYMDAASSLTDIAKLYGDSSDGFSRSSEQIKKEARELTKSMSDTYAAAHSDTYEHQRFYAAQGLTGADLSGSTQQAVRLQMLGDVDTADAQQAITTLTNVYGVQVEQMGQYVDYMNKIEDSTTLTMQDFSAAMPKIGPIIKSFEEDPKEATKAMAEMLEAGKRGGIQSATEIANAWKSIYTKVARPTEQLKNTWNELGAKNGLAQSFMGIVTEQGGNVMEIVKEISTLTQDWSDTDKGRLFSQLAGAQQVARMTTFAQQLANSNDTIKEINKEFDNDPGALAENSRRQEDEIMASPEKRWAQFLNRLRDTGITIGEKVFNPIMTILEKGARFIERMVEALDSLPGPVKGILSLFGGFAVVLGPLVGVLGALIQVGGQMQKLWGTGKAGIGSGLNKLTNGFSNKKLLTPDDRISQLSDGEENYQLKTAIAYRDMMLNMQESTNSVSGTLSQFETQIRKTTQAMVNNPSNPIATAEGRGLRPQDIERRRGILRAGALGSTGEPIPKMEQVYVPPRPAKGRGRQPADHPDRIAYTQAVERRKEAKRVHQAEMEAFAARQADARRVAARYKSFTDYMQNTPQEKLDSNYNKFKPTPARAAEIQKNVRDANAMDTAGMRRIAAMTNQGVARPSGGVMGTARGSQIQFSAFDAQNVRDQAGYVNRDLAAAKNAQAATKNSLKRAQQEKEINRLKSEQIRLNQVLKGSTSEIARESERIKQAYGAQSVGKTGLVKPRGMVDSLRSGNDHITTPGGELLDGTPVSGQRTGQTKSGILQASDKHSRRVIRGMTMEDRKQLEGLRDTNNPYVDAKLSRGDISMTPEHWKMVDTQMKKADMTQDRLAKTQAKIREDSAQYVSNISSAVTGAGALVMMFGGDSSIAQWFGGITTAFGIAMTMMPKTAEKAFVAIADLGATTFSKLGARIGGTITSSAGGFAADMVGSMQAKFLGFSGWMKANVGMLMGWAAVFAAVAAAGVIAYKKLSQESKKYREELERDIGKAKELADLLGFHYVNPIQFQNQGSSITDNERELASQMGEMESMQDTINSLRGKRISSLSDIQDMRLTLTPDAIKILASGGTEADVNKMVRIALIEAGADEATIDDFKLNLKLDDVNTFASSKSVENLQDMIKQETGFWESNLSEIGGGLGDAVRLNWSDQDNLRTSDNAHFTASYTQAAHKLFTDASEAVAAAADEIKPEVAATFMDALEVPEGATQDIKERFDRVHAEYAILISRLSADFAELGEITDVDWTKAEGAGAIYASPTLANSILSGDNHLETAEDAAAQYEQIIKELTDANYKLDPSQKLVISNQVRQAAGMSKLGDWALTAEHKIDEFNGTVAEMPGPPKTLEELVKEMQEVGQGTEEGRKRVESFTAALNKMPGGFTERWHFIIDMTAPDEAGKKLAEMQRGAAESANQWGLDFAAKQMEEQHSDAIDGIRAAGERNLKALEAQQKAADKAMKDREKALGDKHKAQNKALDNQQKEENKQFDKQQKEEKKRFDKQQKEEKKLFDKDIERQKKEFDDAWKQREDIVATYYEASRKYLEDQQNAEDKLDKSRERHAEAERKRQEMLNDLANKNIDINVAIAGGNLDEAARIMNESNAAAQQYYAESGQSISDAESEDRKAARDTRISGLSESESAGQEFLSGQREKATEGFNLNIEGQQEAFGERQEAEGETFDEELSRQKEEFQERLDARKEQLQLQQDQEKEFLNAQREAEAEYYANRKEQIQSVTDATIKGAEDAFAKRKENMEMELDLLKINSGATEQEIKENTANILATYEKYGVDLGGVADTLQEGILDRFHHTLDTASEEMRQDEKWVGVGISIGDMIQAGIDAGMELSPGEALEMSLSGNIPKAIQVELDRRRSNRNFSAYSQGNAPPKGKATGGAIHGPGTGTSDSIPTMLSNGEHVLTAAEVRALGGHGAVERFRAQAMKGAIPGFAAGGPVGGATGSLSSGGGLTVTVAPTGVGGAADGGVLSAVASDVQTIGSQFDQSLSQTAAPAWKLFGDQLIQVKNNAINPTFDAMQTAMSNVAEQTTNTTAGVMTPAWYLFGQDLLTVKDQMFNFAMESMQSGMTSLANGTSDAIANKIIPAWSDGADHIQNMQTNVIDPMMKATQAATTDTAENFGRAADMIGTGWAKVKENSAEPVRYTIGTVFNDGLVGMWNNVAEALDLDKMSKHEFSFATGGVMPGYTPGTDVHHFTSPTGGKLHLSGGEAIMRPEWTKAVGGPSAVHAMNAAAKSGNLSFHDGGVMPEDHAPTRDELRKHQTHADEYHANGGVWGDLSFAGGGLTPLSTAYNKRMWEIVRKISPGIALTSTELWKPSGARRDPHHGTGHAIDVADGGAQRPTPATMGIAKFFHDEYGRAMTELIHYPESGWTNLKNGAPLNYGEPTNSQHMNHVHLATHTVLPDTGGELPMFPAFGGGSAGGMDPVIMEAVNKFNEEKDALKKNIEKHIAGGPNTIMKAIPGKIFTGLTEGMQKKITEAMPMAAMVNMGAYGLNHEDHVREIIAAAKERGLPRQAAKIAIATALVESELRMYANHAVPESFQFAHEAIGSDHDSVGLFQQRNNGAWGTTAQRMNARASAGMFYNALVGIPGWQTMDPGAAAQKVQGSAFPEKYAPRMGEADALIKRVGGWDSIGVEGASPKPDTADAAADKKKINRNDPSKWFDQGGIAQGIGFMEKRTVQPERVLSPEQTKTFGAMVDVLDRSFGRGSNVTKDTVSSPLGNADYTRKITDLDRNMYSGKMSEKEYNPKSQEDIAKSLKPIFNAFQSFIQRDVVPGVVEYATDLIQMKTDEERLEKVSSDIINGIENVYIPSNNEVNMVFGGTVYGDGHLVQIMEDYKRQILSEVRAISDEAARRVAGK